jgi:uncharacterized phage protein gp47/JayE
VSGITTTGFVRKTLDEIKQALADAQHAASELGPTLDTDDEAALGQLNATFASALAECWELLEECYHGFDPDSATDALLVALCSLTGTLYHAATRGTVTLTLHLDAGTTVPAGSLVAVTDRPDIQVATDTGVTAATDGTYYVTAAFVDAGLINAFAGTLEVIVTPVGGWNSVTNAADAIPGTAADTNVTLRQRRENELARRGGSTLAAIRADVLQVDGVAACTVLENTGDGPDANGLPAHSFEALIDDGDTPAAADNDVAQAIWDSKPAGILAYGADDGVAIDENDDNHTVAFSRVTIKPVYIDVGVTTNDDYPVDGDAQVKAAIVVAGQILSIGDDVIALKLRAACFTVSGVVDVPTFELGFSASPSGTANLVIGLRERASFATTRITVL